MHVWGGKMQNYDHEDEANWMRKVESNDEG
jgi:hypothetical protein